MIVREGSAHAYDDQWGATSVAEVFAGGPVRSLRWLEDRDTTGELLDEVWAEGGYLIDLDRHAALVFATPASGYVGWPEKLAELPEADRERATADDAALVDNGQRWLDEIATRWPGFALTWVDGTDAFGTYLRDHRIAVAPAEEYESADRLERAVSDFVTNEARRDQLSRDDAVVPPSKSSVGSLAIVAVVVPLALLTRLLTAPLRWIVRPQDRAEDADHDRRSARLEQLSEQSTHVDIYPDDVESRFERGLTLLALGAPGHAELDFDRCVRALEEGLDSGVELSAAVHNRGIARAKLGLRDLHTADRERAADLGLDVPVVSPLRAGFAAAWQMFRFVSGWG